MDETAATGGAAPPLDAPVEPQAPADIVERWWTDHFPGSPVALVTETWNHAFAAKEDLKRRLADIVAGGR